MKKRILSLVMVLVLCLTLLPVTVLAADNQKLVVGNMTDISEGYWTTDTNGKLTVSSANENWNVHFYYDTTSTTTLHLRNANIVRDIDVSSYMGEAISLQTTDSDASLQIVLEGENYLTGNVPIWVHADKGNAYLTITGSGTLTTTGTAQGTGGIFVQSGPMESKNGSYLTIEGGANVISTCEQSTAVSLVAPAAGEAILTVQGGNLTANGGSSAGIYYGKLDGTVPSDDRRYLRIADNSIIRRNRLSYATGLSVMIQYNTSSGGIIFDGKSGTVYGKVELQEDLKIGEGESLTLDGGASLDAGNHNVIVDGGTLDKDIANSLGDKVKYAPTIMTLSLDTGEVGTAYSQKLETNGTAPITWSSSDLPAWLKLDSSTGVISGIPNAAGTYKFTVTATNDAGSDSKELTLKINAVSVSGVTLDKTKLSLYVGNTETLTATVEPDSATNKNVTWSSSDNTVVTVDSNGKVTAKAPGKAIITVKTEDGSKTATCEVTVVRKNSGIIIIPPATNGNWRQTPIGWWYQNPDGTYPANQWRYLDSGKGYKAWYWFNQYGYMTTGWQKVGNTWYYMNRSGEMQTGWVFVNSQWYYLNSSGAMLTGWVYDGGKWYYMNKDGSMHFGWLSWAGYWYHLDSHGAMSTGWKQVNGKWYYLYAQNGRMAANTTTPDGYRVGADGAWIR